MPPNPYLFETLTYKYTKIYIYIYIDSDKTFFLTLLYFLTRLKRSGFVALGFVKTTMLSVTPTFNKLRLRGASHTSPLLPCLHATHAGARINGKQLVSSRFSPPITDRLLPPTAFWDCSFLVNNTVMFNLRSCFKVYVFCHCRPILISRVLCA